MEWNAQNGWAIGPDESGNLVASTIGVDEFVIDRLDSLIFEDAVWRMKIKFPSRGADLILKWNINYFMRNVEYLTVLF